MKNALLTKLRDHNTPSSEFRHIANKLSHILAAEMASEAEEESVTVSTPIKECVGTKVKSEVVLTAILRAGFAMLPAFMEIFEISRVGFLGMRRDEESAKPNLYYESLPHIGLDDQVYLLDPMIATAGSSILAIERLIAHGAAEEKIALIAILAAPEGVAAIEKRFPKVRLMVLAIDEGLNDRHFIVPGLGDFGDRYFAT